MMHVSFVVKIVAALFLAGSFVAPVLSAPRGYVDPYAYLFAHL